MDHSPVNIGRPAGQMTPRRKQVLECIGRYRDRGVYLSLSRIARECGMSHYRNARRVVNDLKEIGAL